MARWFLLSSLARFGLLLTVAGCGSDVEIRSYSVPIERQQMLAAIVRQGNEAWFFKLKGPASEVAQLRKPVREFLSSIRFSNGEPQWTLPQNWVQEGERSEMRFATLRVSGGESPLEMTVHKFPVPAEMNWDKFRLANINRWRAELEQGELDLAELPDETQTLKIAGVDGTFLDISGTSSPKLTMVDVPFGSGTMGVASSSPGPDEGPAEAGKLPFTFTAPKEWTPRQAGMMQALVFEVRESDDAKVEISVSAASGGLHANVNRWRGQVGLPSADEAELARAIQETTVDGKPAHTVKIAGPAETIVGTIVDAAGTTWFFKLKGTSALAERETERFHAFVKSVKFE